MVTRTLLVFLLLPAVPAPAADPIKLTGHTQEVFAVAYAPAGDRLASTANDGTIRVWTIADGTAVVIKTGGASRAVAFSPDGKWVAGRFETKAALWNAGTGERVGVLAGSDPAKDSTVRRVTFSPDGKLLAVGHDAGQVRLWDVATHKPVADLTRAGKVGELRYTITALAFAPDGKFLAAGSDGGLVVWNVETRAVEKTLSDSAKTVSAAFTPDGKRLLVNEESRVGVFSVWNVAEWTKATTSDRNTSPERFLHKVSAVDDSRALGINENDQLEFYDLTRSARTKSSFATPYKHAPRGFTVSPDRKSVAHFFGNDHTIYIQPLPATK